MLSSPACLVTCCLDEPHFDPRPAACGLNLQVASKLTAEIVAALSDDEVERVVHPSLMHLLGRCEEVSGQPLCDLECLRVALLLPVTVFMRQPRFAEFQARFARYLLQLVPLERDLGRVLATWLSACSTKLFNRIVQAFKDAAAFVFALPSGESEFETEERHSILKTFFEVREARVAKTHFSEKCCVIFKIKLDYVKVKLNAIQPGFNDIGFSSEPS